MNSNRKVGFYTLGCKLNFSETSTIARQFEEGGFVRAQRGERADICVINTCSVTEHADKKCRSLIRRLVREHPGALVAVTGCYAQLKAAEIAAMDGVDLVVGNNEKGSLYELVRDLGERSSSRIHTCETTQLTSFFASFSSGDRTRAFLKVQDGCDYKCSYCTIPAARGGSRNLPVEAIVAEARKIAAKGIREIVLTGVNTGDFGKTSGETFLDLLQELEKVEGIRRYRISSIEPNLLTPQIIAFTGNSAKFMPHFHIPLQAGTDRVLKAMRRRYTTAQFAEKVRLLQREIPEVFIGIDVIVGFPGETDQDFEQTYAFLKELKPSYLHVFPYSERPGTPAADFPGKVSPQVKTERAARLGALCGELHRDYSNRFIGVEARVLIEGIKKGGLVFGHTEHYIRVELPYRKGVVNTLATVRLKASDQKGILAGEWLAD